MVKGVVHNSKVCIACTPVPAGYRCWSCHSMQRAMLPAIQVTISCAKLPITVNAVPCKRCSVGRCITLPANSPIRLGVAIDKAMPDKIILNASGSLMGYPGLNITCHFLASNNHCSSMIINTKNNIKEPHPLSDATREEQYNPISFCPATCLNIW